MQRLAVLSFHTSPLAQPGTGDGGGMNVYVRELSSALARAGVTCDVFTRAWSDDLPGFIDIEPGFRVHHIPAGPLAPVDKEELPGLVGAFTDGVLAAMEKVQASEGTNYEAVHANYWLSGVAGHYLKHELNLPLVSTFHTLDRVKAESGLSEQETLASYRRAEEEAAVIRCSDTVLASCSVEASQIVELYGADPSRLRIVAPGVDHAFFGPGDRSQARRAIGLAEGGPLLLFVGRLQPLKGATVAVRALAEVRQRHRDAQLVMVGGPSGPQGEDEVFRIAELVRELGLASAVTQVPPRPHELLSSYYRAADVVLVPSRSESFGLVALEAAACGTPVVANDVGGLQSLVDPGRTGFLVDGQDPGQFARRVHEILDDPLLAGQLGSGSVLRARRYTWSHAAELLLEIYADLTAGRLVECS
jgi:D-inositol-3-phosphate glycosyltransferase